MDLAALGTTMIGIDRIRREEAAYERGIVLDARTRPHAVHIREDVARALRWTAERISPAPAPA
jgi:hypothetical protein